MSKGKVIGAVLALVVLAVVVPRLVDRTPPQVTEEIWRTESPTLPDTTKVTMGEAPRHPLRGEVALDLRVADRYPGEATLEVSGVPQALTVEEGGAVLRGTLDLSSLMDGQHVVTLTLRDGAWPANRTQMTRMITKDTTPPTLTLARSSRVAAQGTTLGIFVRGDEPLHGPTVQLAGEDVRASVLGDAATVRAVTGIGVKQEPGDVPLVVEARDEAGNVGRLETTVTIDRTDFPFGGYIKLSTKKQADMKDKEKSRESNDKRGAAYASEVGLPIPTAPFLTPVDGILTSPFGKVRKYNTGVERHHLGTDIAAPTGTPVKSAGPGTVVLAELLHIYGNAVIVNHADGVSTSYNHLSKISVKPGDTVKAGQVLGEVGSTGQSTGPHLHWGMVVNGQAVAAEQWTERTFAEPLEGDFE